MSERLHCLKNSPKKLADPKETSVGGNMKMVDAEINDLIKTGGENVDYNYDYTSSGRTMISPMISHVPTKAWGTPSKSSSSLLDSTTNPLLTENGMFASPTFPAGMAVNRTPAGLRYRTSPSEGVTSVSPEVLEPSVSQSNPDALVPSSGAAIFPSAVYSSPGANLFQSMSQQSLSPANSSPAVQQSPVLQLSYGMAQQSQPSSNSMPSQMHPLGVMGHPPLQSIVNNTPSSQSITGSFSNAMSDGSLSNAMSDVVNNTLLQSREALLDNIAESLWKSDETRDKLKPLMIRHKEWKKRQQERQERQDATSKNLNATSKNLRQERQEAEKQNDAFPLRSQCTSISETSTRPLRNPFNPSDVPRNADHDEDQYITLNVSLTPSGGMDVQMA